MPSRGGPASDAAQQQMAHDIEADRAPPESLFHVISHFFDGEVLHPQHLHILAAAVPLEARFE